MSFPQFIPLYNKLIVLKPLQLKTNSEIIVMAKTLKQLKYFNQVFLYSNPI